MFRNAFKVAALSLVLAGGVLGYRSANGSEPRPDCPGKIVCPLTGETICADQCPLQGSCPACRK